MNFIQKLADVINEDCAHVKQRIDFDFYGWKGKFSFKHATHVSLKYPHKYSGNELNQMFPRMESLSLTISKGYRLDCQFPHLKWLFVDEKPLIFSAPFDWTTFGRHNPQVRSICVYFEWNLNYVKRISDALLNLEEMTLTPKYHDGIHRRFYRYLKTWFDAPRVQSIHFPHVKSFSLDVSSWYIRSKDDLNIECEFDIKHEDWINDRFSALEFNQLESFSYTTYSQNYMDGQIDLIVRNKHLNSVTFGSFDEFDLTYKQMKRLVAELPQLKKLTLECEYKGTVDNIVRLFKTTQLETIVAYVPSESLKHYLHFASSQTRGWASVDGNDERGDRLIFTRN